MARESEAGGIRKWTGEELRELLGPAEAQYQALTAVIVGGAGTLPCESTIIDGSANDMDGTANGVVVFGVAWNDLAGESGYRVQLDANSAAFVNEDLFNEVVPDTTSSVGWSTALGAGASATHTYRILGHVGHPPAHGADPIAGDVVSNECTVRVFVPEV
jgi:hypothetical protein